MVARMWQSLLFSLEWRIYAFAITTLFLWASTGTLVFALGNALGLQIILLFAHSTWYYFRSGQGLGHE